MKKRCTKCGTPKIMDEFDKDRRSPDGKTTICKACRRVAQQTRLDNNPVRREKLRASSRNWRHSPAGRKWYRRHVRTEDYRLKRRAHVAVARAIAKGTLRSPIGQRCHYCPAPADSYHHHNGYDDEHKLDVVPTCVGCHGKEHRVSSSACP